MSRDDVCYKEKQHGPCGEWGNWQAVPSCWGWGGQERPLGDIGAEAVMTGKSTGREKSMLKGSSMRNSRNSKVAGVAKKEWQGGLATGDLGHTLAVCSLDKVQMMGASVSL